MTKSDVGGVSKRSLLLLGGLAALALNRDARRALVSGSQNLWQGAQGTLDDRVRPALSQAATQAQQLAQEAARRGVSTLESVREDGVPRAQSLLGEALSAASGFASTAASTAQERAAHLRDEAQSLSAEQSKKARKALKAARKNASKTLDGRVKPALVQAQEAGLGLFSEVQDRVQDVIGEGADTVDGKRRQMERRLTRARRDAERELAAAGKKWNGKKLEKAVARKVKPLHKTLTRELKVLEKQAKLARRSDKRGSALGGGLTTLVVVGAGTAVLARTPALRQNIMNAVDTVSPEAASALHGVGRRIRGVVGDVWVERKVDAPGERSSTATGYVSPSDQRPSNENPTANH